MGKVTDSPSGKQQAVNSEGKLASALQQMDGIISGESDGFYFCPICLAPCVGIWGVYGRPHIHLICFPRFLFVVIKSGWLNLRDSLSEEKISFITIQSQGFGVEDAAGGVLQQAANELTLTREIVGALWEAGKCLKSRRKNGQSGDKFQGGWCFRRKRPRIDAEICGNLRS